MLETNVETVQNQERFINVKSLLIHSLLRWKLILAAALLMCLFGGYREYTRQKSLINTSGSSAETAEEGLISDDDYDALLKNIDDQMAERYEYMSHSLFMKLNPYKTNLAYASYYVLSPERGNAEYDSYEGMLMEEDKNAAMLMAALKDYVRFGMDWTQETDKYGVEEAGYLREMVSAEMDNNVLLVKAYYSDDEGCRSLLDYATRSLEEKFNEMIEKTGLTDYELVMLDTNADAMMMGANYSWYTNRLTEVENLVKNRNNLITNLKSENEVAEEIKSVNKKKVLKKGITFGVIGAIAAWMAVLAVLVLSGKVLSAEEMNKYYHLTNLAVLDSRHKGKKASGITRKIYTLEKDRKGILTDDTRLELADNMISQLCPSAKKIGLIGSVSKEVMDEVRSQLSVTDDREYVSLDAIASDVSQRKQLTDMDAVVLLAENEKTSYAATDDLLRLAKNYNKQVIGSITC